jgi:hypothetical protein
LYNYFKLKLKYTVKIIRIIMQLIQIIIILPLQVDWRKRESNIFKLVESVISNFSGNGTYPLALIPFISSRYLRFYANYDRA